MNGKTNGGNVMKMTKSSKPELVQLFENLLWANAPKNWILKTTYFQKTLFVSMLIETPQEQQCQKIRRSFDVDIIRKRSDDLWGMASDCVDQMKTEVKIDRDTI
jgi:hypothetical protein